jgi:hypothetical protein
MQPALPGVEAAESWHGAFPCGLGGEEVAVAVVVGAGGAEGEETGGEGEEGDAEGPDGEGV